MVAGFEQVEVAAGLAFDFVAVGSQYQGCGDLLHVFVPFHQGFKRRPYGRPLTGAVR